MTKVTFCKFVLKHLTLAKFKFLDRTANKTRLNVLKRPSVLSVSCSIAAYFIKLTSTQSVSAIRRFPWSHQHTFLHSVGGFHMTSSKRDNANYEQFAPNFGITYETIHGVLV